MSLAALRKLGEVDRSLAEARRRHDAAARLAAPQEHRAAEAKAALQKLQDEGKAGQRDVLRLEGDVKAKQAEIDKAQVTLNQIKNNEEYQAVLRTIAQKKQEMSALETAVLEAYDRNDQRAARRKELEARAKQAEGEVRSAQQRCQAEVAERRADVTRLEALRAEAAKLVDPGQLALYDRVLASHGDSAIAGVQGEICQGCYMKVRPDQIARIRGDEQIETCFTCRRILFYQAE